jgi:GntR family transcriptional regulator/MocR family aminotransferase
VEEPGYSKIRRIYAAGGVESRSAPMDDQGVLPQALGDARILHISPSHHFPSGLVTPVSRRLELLQWAQQAGGWIIEDDYDSEFRFDARPLSAMYAMDPERVIYMNSFSKSLAPSIRISYLILPKSLMERFRRELGFYSCTVPSFEQYTLARFLSRGHFEKHINRTRRASRARRNRLLDLIRSHPMGARLTIQEQDAGLHFLLKVETDLPDSALTDALSAEGIRFPALSGFYHQKKEDLHTLVVSYSGLKEETMEKALDVLYRSTVLPVAKRPFPPGEGVWAAYSPEID